MQRSSVSTQSKKPIREKTDTTIASIYGMPPPTNNNTASRLAQIDDMKYFFATATQQWDHNKALKQFDFIGGESVSCVLWDGVFFITGTDIVRSLTFRFHAFGRPVTNAKKFEEGIFSDLRNLKPGQDARLENPKSELLEMLYKNNCIRTQKKQKVFFWFSVPHDRLFLDALERDLKREKMGMEPTTKAVAQPATSITLEATQDLFTQLKRTKSKPIPNTTIQTDHSSSLGATSPVPSLYNVKDDSAQQKRSRVNSVPSILGQKQQLQLFQQRQRQSHGSYFSTSPLPSLTTGRIRTNISNSMLSPPDNMYDTVTLSDISKSSPLHPSDFTDLSNGVHQLDITSSLSSTSSTSSILQHNVPPSRSIDGKAIFGNLGLFDGTSSYKSRRRRSSSVSTSLLNYGAGGPERIRKCSTIRTPTSSTSGLINSSSSRLAMAAAKAGFAAATPPQAQPQDWRQDYYCPVPDCRHLFKRAEHLERHMQALHSLLCTVCGKSFYRPESLAQHHRTHKDNVLNHHSPSGSSRCSTLSPMLDVDFEMPQPQPTKDDISSSSASSPRSYNTMKLLDSFKPNEETQQPEYPMNDVSFDQQPSQDSLDLNMDMSTYLTMYAPYVDQQNYMM